MTGVIAALVGMRGAPPLVVNAVDVSGVTTVPGTAISDTPNTEVTGGVPGYTYSWIYVSGDTGIQIDNPSIQNPRWSFDFTGPGAVSGVWQVTVTDSASNTASDTINISLSTI